MFSACIIDKFPSNVFCNHKLTKLGFIESADTKNLKNKILFEVYYSLLLRIT